jgi:anti-sigma B factor antagonist
MTRLDIKTTERPGGVQLRLTGELDIASAANLEAELGRVEDGGPALIVIDLRPLEFMDSSGLRSLVAADTRAREQGRRLVLIRGSERVQRVFSITRLDERLEIVDDDQSLAGAA